jgi:UMF1 family MFS transporter
MIPAGKEASFFGLYEVSERGTSWMGPLVFSIVVARTGSYRQALLSLIFFFIVGLIVLVITNTDEAIQQASAPLTESSS